MIYQHHLKQQVSLTGFPNTQDLLICYKSILFCENLADFYEARLHEATFNLHTHAWIFSSLSIASVDGKQDLSEVVFSDLVCTTEL